jgi:hypothetical protein
VNLATLMAQGWVINKLGQQMKRFVGEWHLRYIWTATHGETMMESAWLGFATPEECLADMVTKLTKTRVKVIDMPKASS